MCQHSEAKKNFHNFSNSSILRPVLRNLTEKVRWVWFWRWEFSVKLKPCYVVLIPTLRRTLRLFFLGMVKTAFYSPGSRKTREHRTSAHRLGKFFNKNFIKYTSIHRNLYILLSIVISIKIKVFFFNYTRTTDPQKIFRI